MDWTLAIEKNREALKSILVMLVAMVEAVGQRPNTLPRHLHRLVLSLLRPAEFATRRLIIVAARGLVVELIPSRPRKPRQEPIRNRRNGYGTGIVIPPGPLPEWALALAPKRNASLSLPLFDPYKRFGRRRRYVKDADMPRISLLGFGQENPLSDRPRLSAALPPSPDDTLDAARLHRRIEAMGRALDDLPLQATRLARWQARQNAMAARDDAVSGTQGRARASARRFSPMRPGRPPGWRRRPTHQVHEVLNELHGLAVWARRDTS